MDLPDKLMLIFEGCDDVVSIGVPSLVFPSSEDMYAGGGVSAAEKNNWFLLNLSINLMTMSETLEGSRLTQVLM